MSKVIRDFRVLGPKLGLFTHFDKEIIYLPKGEVLYWSLVDKWKKMHVEMGFQFVHAFKSFDPLKLHIYSFEKEGHLVPFRLASLSPEGHDFESIFVKTKDISSEISSCLHLLDQMIKIFGFKTKVLYTFPKGAENLFEEALKKLNIPYEQSEGDFEEGRVDFHLIDNAGVETSGPFVVLSKGPKRDVHMIYRSLFGSMERWIALMIESDR